MRNPLACRRVFGSGDYPVRRPPLPKQRRQCYCPNTRLLQGRKSYLRWICFALPSLHFFVLSSNHGPIRSQVN